MSARKKPPTRAQHVELGALLQDMRESLLGAVSVIGTAYPKASRPTRAAVAALKAVDDLRFALDNVSYQELKGDDWSPTIYYGANREVRAAWLAANPLDDVDGAA